MNFFDAFKKPWRDNWAETLQFIVVAVGLVVSGFWAYHTFDTLLQKDRAEAELKKTTAELTKSKAELADLQNKINGVDSSVIDIDLKTTNLPNGNVGLIVNVIIKNTGTNDVRMSWVKSPLKIYLTKYKGDKLKGESSLSPLLYSSLQDQNSQNKKYIEKAHLLVGVKKTLSFFTEIEKSGLYYLAFEASVDLSIKNKLKNSKKLPVWFASSYIFIETK